MNEIVETIAAHEKRWQSPSGCSCGARSDGLQTWHAKHLAQALAAEGFGLLATPNPLQTKTVGVKPVLGAIEAAARAEAPHLWNGKFEVTLLRWSRILFTPEQAAEAAEQKRQEHLARAETYLTAAAPIMEAKVLGQAADALEIKLGEMGEPAGREEDQFQNGFADAIALLILRSRAATIEGKSE